MSTSLPHVAVRRILLLAIVGIALGGCGKKAPKEQETGHPTPIPVLPRKNYDTARLYSGLALKSRVESQQSDETSLGVISNTNSYELDMTLHVRWPSAATNSIALCTATPELAWILPDLDQLLLGATPSADFAHLLTNKEASLRANLSSLQKLPYRDSLFDCQTILNLRNQASGRAALLVQAIMNVNTDGSDGDRNLTIDKLSSTFQPQTNYRWPKTGPHPNPCLREVESRLALINAELSNGALSPETKASLTKEREYQKATAEELRRWDFLVGTADPFIVLPSFMVGKSAGQPGIGDYAVVIAHGKLYPAILGDLGPNSKIGEASLRLCREIEEKSGADRRPVSRPEVVYLVFPGSAEKPFSAPDYNHWSECCRALWKEFGGSPDAPWQEWTCLEKPWPTPTPTATPTQPPVEPPSPKNNPTGTNPASPDSSTTTTSPTNSTATSILSTPAINQ